MRWFFDHTIISWIYRIRIKFFCRTLAAYLAYLESAPLFFNNLCGLSSVNISTICDVLLYHAYSAYSPNEPNELNLALSQ